MNYQQYLAFVTGITNPQSPRVKIFNSELNPIVFSQISTILMLNQKIVGKCTDVGY